MSYYGTESDLLYSPDEEKKKGKTEGKDEKYEAEEDQSPMFAKLFITPQVHECNCVK